MVKNKALPDSAPPVWSLSLSLADWALSRLGSRVFSLANAMHPEGTPWILPRLDPDTQGLCTCWSFCLECSSPSYSPGLILCFLQNSAQISVKPSLAKLSKSTTLSPNNHVSSLLPFSTLIFSIAFTT